MNPCPKIKPVRDKPYREFIRSQPCLICGGSSMHHHEPLFGHGMASKGPDDESLPLCPECHRQRHDKGRYTFYEIHNICWRAYVGEYQLRFQEYKQKSSPEQTKE